MLFVTVGTDLPFDRLIRTVDAWAARNQRSDVFAQIGETKLRPKHIAYSEFLEPPQFQERFQSASLIIAHAGMGTILSALRYQKPILVMPRRASLGEQRNEHQLATAKHLLELGKITVAFDENDLSAKLDQLDALEAREPIGPYAAPALIRAIRDFIHADTTAVAAEIRGRRTEVGVPTPEVGVRMSEVKGQKAEVGSRR